MTPFISPAEVATQLPAKESVLGSKESRRRQVARGRSFKGSLRHGLSLLEVILAIAILGGSLAVLGELLRLGSMAAARSRDLSTAELLCETKLAEVASGIEPMDGASSTPIDDSGEWLYSVTVGETDQEGLLSILVTIQQNPETAARPVMFSLTRWVIDPTVQQAAEDQAAEAKATAAAAAGQSASAGSDGSTVEDPADAATGGGAGAGGGTGGGTGGGNQGGGAGGGTPQLPPGLPPVPDFSAPGGGGFPGGGRD